MKLYAVGFCVLLSASPALAQNGGTMSGSGATLSGQNDATDGGSAGGSDRGANGERLVCRRVETDSTSHLATRRVCRTAQQWRDAQRSN